MYLISREWSIETPNYFYKTTCLVNGKIYYGSGSKENYLGSGVDFTKDLKLYGPDKFHIDKLRFFEKRSDAYDYEERFLMLYDIKSLENTYNKTNGGWGSRVGQVPVRDSNGKTFSVSTKDPRYLNGELNITTKGRQVTEKQRNLYRTTFGDQNNYMFYNIKSNELFEGKIFEFIDKYNLVRNKLMRIIRKEIRHHHNWIILWNKRLPSKEEIHNTTKNHNIDNNIYNIKHKTGDVFVGTRKEFTIKTNISISSRKRFFNKKTVQWKGWILVD